MQDSHLVHLLEVKQDYGKYDRKEAPLDAEAAEAESVREKFDDALVSARLCWRHAIELWVMSVDVRECTAKRSLRSETFSSPGA